MSELVVERTGDVLRLLINAPDRLNAVDTPLVDGLADAFSEHADARVGLLTGAGRAFCSGARITGEGPNVGILVAAERLITAMTSASFPIIAAVDGPAAGIGVPIALAADITVASERSYFMLAFTKIGLMPDGGASALVSASLGRARAMRLAMSGEKLAAMAALDMGLIAYCVPDAEYDRTVEDLVTELADGPTLAYAHAKRAINLATLTGLAESVAYEQQGQALLLHSEDYAEGGAAFKAKRQPTFRGR